MGDDFIDETVVGELGYGFTVGDSRDSDSPDDDVIELGVTLPNATEGVRALAVGFSLDDVKTIRDVLDRVIQRRF